MAKSKNEAPEFYALLEKVDTEIARFNCYTSGWDEASLGRLVVGWLGYQRAKELNDYLEFKENE